MDIQNNVGRTSTMVLSLAILLGTLIIRKIGKDSAAKRILSKYKTPKSLAAQLENAYRSTGNSNLASWAARFNDCSKEDYPGLVKSFVRIRASGYIIALLNPMGLSTIASIVKTSKDKHEAVEKLVNKYGSRKAFFSIMDDELERCF